ncbi:glycosyltransferase family 4 protein [Streptococcus merionis]|uniref:glycosyltransferase family 4 protein n=1 Tax=Streptococcus merionis TaxID=400065 RepID=UPI0035152DDC
MKKILYLHAGAEMYGADKVLLELVKGLDKNKFEAHVILPNNGALFEELKKVGAYVKVVHYPILRRKYFNVQGIVHYIRDYFKYSKVLLDYVREYKINIIHNNTTAVLEGIYLKKRAKIPLIWHVHEIIVKPKMISDFINFLMGRNADKIVTVSKAVKDHVVKSRFIQDNQVEVIYNGVDNDVYFVMEASKIRQKFGISQESVIIGMVGRVNSWKGQNDFLEAVTPILEENPDFVAFLAGSAFEGEEWRVKELDDKIAGLSVSKQIQRIDYYPNTMELYNMFDLFVLPSTNPDPLPTVVLEAMACGKPIVGYRHGGITEMVLEGYNGLIADVKNPNSLSKKIKELLMNDTELAEFGRHSVERQKSQFSLDSYISHFTKLYRECRSDK